MFLLVLLNCPLVKYSHLCTEWLLTRVRLLRFQLVKTQYGKRSIFEGTFEETLHLTRTNFASFRTLAAVKDTLKRDGAQFKGGDFKDLMRMIIICLIPKGYTIKCSRTVHIDRALGLMISVKFPMKYPPWLIEDCVVTGWHMAGEAAGDGTSGFPYGH